MASSTPVKSPASSSEAKADPSAAARRIAANLTHTHHVSDLSAEDFNQHHHTSSASAVKKEEVLPKSNSADSGFVRKRFDKNDPFSTGLGERSVCARVHFAHEFSKPPRVMVGLAGIDTSSVVDTRISLDVGRVTTKYFILVIHTWNDTVIYGCDVSWIAVL